MIPLLTASQVIVIPFNDLDPMNVVWHGNYLRYFEAARSELLNMLNYNYGEMQESGYMWPIVDVHIKYIRPLRLHQRIRIEATLLEYENRLKIGYKIYDDQTNQLLTKGSTTQVAVNQSTSELEFRSPSILIDRVEETIQGTIQ